MAIIAMALARFVAQYWSVLADHEWQLQWPWVFVAVMPMALFLTLHASAWRACLVWTGLGLSWYQGLWAWSRSSLARYLPTPVWATGSRIYVSMQLGASWRSAALCYAAELGGAIAVAVGLSLLALPAWTSIPSVVADLAAAVAVLLALPLALVMLSRWPRSTLTTAPLGPAQAIVWCGTYAGSFLVYGAAHLAVLNALAVPAPPAGITIGVAALAWALGTINVFSPSGIGTRELVLIYGLQGYADPPELLALAALTRLAAVAAELALFALLAIRAGRRIGHSPPAPGGSTAER
jgi:hypothetical protein